MFPPEINVELQKLEKNSLLRNLRYVVPVSPSKFVLNGEIIVNAASNNYLGLSHHPEVINETKKVIDRYGTGAGASRLITGSLDIHAELEEEIALIKNSETSLVFSSGYAANTGTISALVGKGDVIFSDRLNHASIIDGCRLSRADIIVYNHLDVTDLEKKLRKRDEYRKALIVTDTVFSVDGDIAPLKDLKKLAEEHCCMLMVDEAHATGVFGEKGGGVTESMHVEPDINMGTLSKALASQGGYVAGSSTLRDFLVNKARSFIYSTALSPASVASALAAIRVIRKNPRLRKKLWENVELVRKGLEELGFYLISRDSHITPVLIGDERSGVQFSQELLKNGVYCPILRYPTVERGKSRVRVSVTSAHTREDIERILEAFERSKKVVKNVQLA